MDQPEKQKPKEAKMLKFDSSSESKLIKDGQKGLNKAYKTVQSNVKRNFASANKRLAPRTQKKIVQAIKYNGPSNPYLEDLDSKYTETVRSQNRINEILNRGKLIREKQKRLSDITNLMRAKNIFKKNEFTMDPLDDSHSILKAPSVFVNSTDIMNPNRLNILQTRQAGNDIMQRRADSINILGSPSLFNSKKEKRQPIRVGW